MLCLLTADGTKAAKLSVAFSDEATCCEENPVSLSCGRRIALLGHLFHQVDDQVLMLILLDLSAASSSVDQGALWSFSSPFLISAGSCGLSSSARTVN